MVDRGALRLSAGLVLAGILLSIGAGSLHPGRENPNDHAAAFAEYAADAAWTPVHLGQFVGMAVLIAGLLVLSAAVRPETGSLRWAGRLAEVAGVIALALYGALQAIDGVALKQAVDAWAGAAPADKPVRFAAAEVVRWLEWAMRSYQSMMLGVTLLLLAAVILGTARLPRLLGAFLGLAGLAYMVQGWILGTEGFSPANTVPTLAGYLLVVAAGVWLLVHAWRARVAGPDLHAERGVRGR